jgi:hypothetical protein
MISPHELAEVISSVGFPIVMALLFWWERFKFTESITAHQAKELEILARLADLTAQVHSAVVGG